MNFIEFRSCKAGKTCRLFFAGIDDNCILELTSQGKKFAGAELLSGGIRLTEEEIRVFDFAMLDLCISRITRGPIKAMYVGYKIMSTSAS